MEVTFFEQTDLLRMFVNDAPRLHVQDQSRVGSERVSVALAVSVSWSSAHYT